MAVFFAGRVGFDYDFGTSRSLSQAASATFADSSGEDVFQVRNKAAKGARGPAMGQRRTVVCRQTALCCLPARYRILSSHTKSCLPGGRQSLTEA